MLTPLSTEADLCKCVTSILQKTGCEIQLATTISVIQGAVQNSEGSTIKRTNYTP